MVYLLYLLVLILAELFYFKIADKFNIIDKPNHRSSHTAITIRGGGIIFPVAVLLWYLFNGFQYPFFVIGLLAIATVSFVDDIKDISRGFRMLIHLSAVSLAFFQLQLFGINWYYIIITYVIFIGLMNAYNFMDGINGITGLYSLVLLASLWWVNSFQTHFVDADFILVMLMALLIFNFFNFRNKAKCFAGDVGSVSMAFIVIFLLFKLVLITSNVFYLLFLLVYGIDAFFTIAIRLSRGENIFEAHRLHLYQLMVNENKWPHLAVAILYATLQLVANVFILNVIKMEHEVVIMILIILFFLFLYIFVRKWLYNRHVFLLHSKN